MTKQKIDLTKLPEWHALTTHYRDMVDQDMRSWFIQDKNRYQQYSLSCGELLLDYSRNRINQQTLALLCQLARSVGLSEKIQALLTGQPINCTEQRAVLHTALRDKNQTPTIINGENIAQQIRLALNKMQIFSEQIHSHQWRGVTGKPIAHVVNIGIGGSHLGPQMCCHALKEAAISPLKFHFIASIDKSLIDDVFEQIDPEATLFIISSKTFTTLETLTNARTIIGHMQNSLGKEVIQRHFVAVTANQPAAMELGIPENNIFPIWEWVNGRYSVWSAIGMPLFLMIGAKGFNEFLSGAFLMDQHFQHSDFQHNMPVILALLGIWYSNFFQSQVQAIIPYSYRLRYLIPYLQQAEMESNGKSINLIGEQITYTTGSVVFGEEGSSGQHSYHQLLHQGQHLIPADFLLVGKSSANTQTQHQDILVSSGLSQAQALMQGKTFAEAKAELLAKHCLPEQADYLAKHKTIPGNRPSNILFLDRLTPKNLGSLLALYEHKIFVQGAIWDINSFDQWGVELGKQLLPSILQHLQGQAISFPSDSATSSLIDRIRCLREES